MARLQSRISAYRSNLSPWGAGGIAGVRENVKKWSGTAPAPAASSPASQQAPSTPSKPASDDYAGRASNLLAGAQQPFSAAYDSKVSAITTGLNNTLAGFNYDEGRIRQQFGFDDTSDPFSRAKMLQRAYEQRQTGNTNSYAAAGQLYSGALNRQRAGTLHDYQQSEHQLRNQYTDLLNQLAQRRAEAAATAQQQTADAGWEKLQDSLANPVPSTATAKEAAAMNFAGGDAQQLAAILALQAPQDLEALRRARRRARRGS